MMLFLMPTIMRPDYRRITNHSDPLLLRWCPPDGFGTDDSAAAELSVTLIYNAQ